MSMPSADPRNIGRNRSLLARAVFTPQGEVRTLPLVGLVVFALAILAAGMFAALVAAGAGSPEVLGVWVAVAFLAIKLPLLGLLWYLLGRGGESTVRPEWSPQEAERIIGYLESEAVGATERPDAVSRLEYYAREAWFVADKAPESARARAVDVAVRIEGLAARARTRMDARLTQGQPAGAGERGSGERPGERLAP